MSATVLDVIGQMFYKPVREQLSGGGHQCRHLRPDGRQRGGTGGAHQADGDAYWRQLFTQLDQLRVGRLTSCPSPPRAGRDGRLLDLIYRLSDADVEEALTGPIAAAAAGR